MVRCNHLVYVCLIDVVYRVDGFVIHTGDEYRGSSKCWSAVWSGVTSRSGTRMTKCWT